jgi:hypothetical protein
VAALEMPPGKLARALTSLTHADVLIRLALGLAGTVVLVVVMRGWSPPPAYRTGYVPSRDVVARVAFRKPDPDATDEKRELARKQARAVYSQNPEPLVQLRAELRNTILGLTKAENFEAADKRLWALLQPPRPAGLPALSKEQEADDFKTFRQEVAGEEKLKKVDLAVADVLAPYEKQGLLKEPGPGNQQEILVYPDGKPELAEPVKLSDVLIGDGLAIRKRLADDLGSPDLADHLFAWLKPRLAEMSTLTLDEARTRQKQDQAANEVEEVYLTFEPGQTLAKAGEPLGPKQLDLLSREHAEVDAQCAAPQKAARATGVWAMIVGLFALCALYMNRRERRLLANFKRLTTMLLLAMATVVAARWASHDPWRAELVPMLLFGEIVAIAYHQEVALLLSGVVALILVLAIGLGLGEFLVLFGVTATAILQLGFVRSRGKLIYVGFNSGVVAVFLTIGVAVIDNQPLGWTTLSDAARNGALTLAAGFLTTGLLPLIERLFGVLTDISLLELGDVAHPLLQELVRRAPSTYNHSITVGTIAEAAADAIGARGLLLRVGAYFHDIGKMLKPGYFIENQGDEANRHETLVPTMSSLVIIAHIKDGANLARQHHLPEPIIDFILQHHGTTLVGYFFERANQQSKQNPDAGEVEESTFRYPGPKPQTKEAAVLMLADAVESASRTLVGPTPARIESLVREIAERRLEDGQFDDSGLTLRELRTIENSMIKSVTAIYHGRVKYPDQKTPQKTP